MRYWQHLTWLFFLFLIFGSCSGSGDIRPDNEQIYRKAGKFSPRMRDAGVQFRVFAPQAQTVYVAGSFNNWKKSTHPLKKNSDGVWQAVVPLPAGYYSYAYYIDNSWHKDPHNPDLSLTGFFVSHFEVTPGNKLHLHEGPYSASRAGYFYRKLRSVQTPRWVRNALVCKIDIRTFTSEGTIAAAANRLAALKHLGCTTLVLAPLQPVSSIKFSLSSGSGDTIAVTDVRALDKRLGSVQDVRKFVSSAHALGIRVIMSWNAAMLADSAALVRTKRNWFSQYLAKSLPGASGTAWFRYHLPTPRIYMVESMFYWINHYGLDGFYCDLAGFVPITLWTELRSMVHASKPSALFVSDTPSPYHNAAAFDLTLDSASNRFLSQLLEGKRKAYFFEDFYLQQRYSFPKNALRLVGLTSQGLTTIKQDGSKYLPVAAVIVTMGSIPYLDCTTQQVVNTLLEKISKQDKNVSLFLRLLALRVQSNALAEGSIRFLRNSAASKVITFMRVSELERVFVAVNFSDKPAEFTLLEQSVKSAQLEGPLIVFDLFTGKKIRKINFSDDALIRLPAGGIICYRL